MSRTLNYFEKFFIIISAISGCVLNFEFASLACILTGLRGSASELKICALTAGIKKSKLIIKEKRKKKHNNIVLSAKAKPNTIKVLIFKTLIDSCINHDEFVSIDNVLREYDEIKEEIKNP